MYAIIEDSGTQIKVAKGQVLDIDLRDNADAGETIQFDRVLAVGNADGSSVAKLGKPYVAGASVTAKVIDTIIGDKLLIGKYKRRKNYRRKKGHRQPYLRIEIAAING